MKIAVVGGGIAGITAAHTLSARHDVTLFERNDYVGGHTHTRTVTEPNGHTVPIDTGFIVCNPKNYPHFFRFLAELGVELQPSDMSFGFVCEASGVRYVGPSLKEFWRTWTNLLSPRFLAFIAEQTRFNRRLTVALEQGAVPDVPLGQYLNDIGASDFLRQNYLAPLIAAIWSAPDVSAEDFPLPTFARFFANHGMLEFAQRPEWFTVRGGSCTYVRAFLKAFPGTVRMNSPIARIEREATGCRLTVAGEEALHFDKVVIAAHADEALAMLADPSTEEREALGAWRYSRNNVVLHTDKRRMPESRRVWAAWNYYRPRGAAQSAPVAITYYMNRLQRLETDIDYFVSLNQRAEIDPATIVFETTYTHPIYDQRSVASQALVRRLNGARHTHYCGAYLGYGFHEDGVVAALEAVRPLGASR